MANHGESRRGQGQGLRALQRGDQAQATGQRIPPGEVTPGDRPGLPGPVQHHLQSPIVSIVTAI